MSIPRSVAGAPGGVQCLGCRPAGRFTPGIGALIISINRYSCVDRLLETT